MESAPDSTYSTQLAQLTRLTQLHDSPLPFSFPFTSTIQDAAVWPSETRSAQDGAAVRYPHFLSQVASCKPHTIELTGE
jgi:hypothetical protein